MKHAELKADIEVRFSDIDKLLRRVLGSFDAETIHLFRVQVKKLHAFIYMLNSGHNDLVSNRKLPRRLRKFYHLTGDIRTLQLQRQHIFEALKGTGNAQPWSYINSLDIVMTEKMRQAREILHGRHTFQKEKEYIIEGLPERLGRKLVENYMDARLHAFWHQILADPPTEAALHEARRILKDLLFTWDYFDAAALDKIKESLAGKDQILSLAHLLGVVHDAGTGIHLLEPESIRHITSERERILLLTIKEQWQNEKEHAKQQIYDQLFVSHHHV